MRTVVGSVVSAWLVCFPWVDCKAEITSTSASVPQIETDTDGTAHTTATVDPCYRALSPEGEPPVVVGGSHFFENLDFGLAGEEVLPLDDNIQHPLVLTVQVFEVGRIRSTVAWVERRQNPIIASDEEREALIQRARARQDEILQRILVFARSRYLQRRLPDPRDTRHHFTRGWTREFIETATDPDFAKVFLDRSRLCLVELIETNETLGTGRVVTAPARIPLGSRKRVARQHNLRPHPGGPYRRYQFNGRWTSPRAQMAQKGFATASVEAFDPAMNENPSARKLIFPERNIVFSVLPMEAVLGEFLPRPFVLDAANAGDTLFDDDPFLDTVFAVAEIQEPGLYAINDQYPLLHPDIVAALFLGLQNPRRSDLFYRMVVQQFTYSDTPTYAPHGFLPFGQKTSVKGVSTQPYQLDGGPERLLRWFLSLAGPDERSPYRQWLVGRLKERLNGMETNHLPWRASVVSQMRDSELIIEGTVIADDVFRVALRRAVPDDPAGIRYESIDEWPFHPDRHEREVVKASLNEEGERSIHHFTARITPGSYVVSLYNEAGHELERVAVD